MDYRIVNSLKSAGGLMLALLWLASWVGIIACAFAHSWLWIIVLFVDIFVGAFVISYKLDA